MFVIYHDDSLDEADVCETLDEVRRVLEERRDSDPDYFDNYRAAGYHIREVGAEVPFNVTPARMTVGTECTDIPAPNPGETVLEYAQRLIKG